MDLIYTAPYELKKKQGDAGYDLFAQDSEMIMIASGEVYHVHTGIRVIIPEGYYGKIEGRSSYPYARLAIGVLGGVIDHGYTGEIVVFLLNAGNEMVALNPEKAIAQLVIIKIAEPTPVPHAAEQFDVVADARQFWRGQKGFGSTDRMVAS